MINFIYEILNGKKNTKIKENKIDLKECVEIME